MRRILAASSEFHAILLRFPPSCFVPHKQVTAVTKHLPRDYTAAAACSCFLSWFQIGTKVDLKIEARLDPQVVGVKQNDILIKCLRLSNRKKIPYNGGTS